MAKNTNKEYSLTTILMHWAVALLIIGLFGLGIWMRGLSYYDPWYNSAPALHKSLGLLVLFLLLFRLAWRAYDAIPAPEDSLQPWERRFSKLVHVTLYLFSFIIVLSGYLIATADNTGVSFFELFDLPPLFTAYSHQEDTAGEIHEILSWILMGIVALHALAALKHHFVDKDATLSRMLRFRPRR